MGAGTGLAIAGLAASVLGQGANWASTNKTNLRTRQHNEHMYGVQRADSISDWLMQNEYNSPTAQMQRLRDAKLNPNLIYGNGAEAMSSSQPRASSPGSYAGRAPEINSSAISQSLMGFYDAKVKEAQTDNLRTLNTVNLEEAELKRKQQLNVDADTSQKLTGNEKQVFDLGLARDLRSNTVDIKNAELNKMKVDTQYTLNSDQRQAALNASTLNEAVHRILLMDAQRSKIPSEIAELKARASNVLKDTELKNEDLRLKKQGIQPHDALWQRSVKQALDALDIAPPKQAMDDIRKYGPSLPIPFFKK